MKALYIFGGILFGLFTLAQLLQLVGVIGVGFSIAGVGLNIFGGLLSYLCFKKAAALPTQ